MVCIKKILLCSFVLCSGVMLAPRTPPASPRRLSLPLLVAIPPLGDGPEPELHRNYAEPLGGVLPAGAPARAAVREPVFVFEGPALEERLAELALRERK